MATKNLLGFIDTGVNDKSPLLQLLSIVFQSACRVMGFSAKGIVFTSRVLLLNNAANDVNAL